MDNENMDGNSGYTAAAASSIIFYQSSHHSNSSSSWWASWIMVCQGDWTCLARLPIHVDRGSFQNASHCRVRAKCIFADADTYPRVVNCSIFNCCISP